MSFLPLDVETQLPSSLAEPLERYLSFLKYERAYSAHTVSTYLNPLVSLSLHLQRIGVTNWSKVQESDLSLWLIEFKKAGLKASTIQNKISASKGFFRFLLQRDVIKVDPSELISGPKSSRTLPKNMSVDELDGLLAFVPETTIEYRDKAILELFYSSGLRLSELAQLDKGSLSFDSAEVRVIGKGNRTRVVPVGKQAINAIKAWLHRRSEYDQSKGDNPALFLSKLGNRLSTRQIEQRLKHWALKQGINGNLHPHKLRHSFASHMLESSSDLRAVQELLGHQNLSTTQIYTHLDYQHLASVYDTAHPRAKKKSD